MTTMTITTLAERRKRLKLKRIVVSEQNYVALKKPGHARDLFNDVISKLLRIHRNYQEKQKQESDDDSSSGFLPESLSELFERDRQQLDELLRLRKRGSANNQTSEQAIGK
jgi:predicted CopG family antitoxin